MKSFFEKIRRNCFLFFAGTVLLAIVFVASAAPWISPYDPTKADLSLRLQPPLTKGHFFGTDQLGRDLLSRVIYGARISIFIGIIVVLISGFFGTLIGLISGFYGGLIDRIMMRFVDVQLSFPFIILALTIAAVLGPSFQNIIITLAVSSWAIYARLVRGEVLGLKEKQYIQACLTIGLPDWRISVMHILPNIFQSVIVVASLEVGRMIIGEASISFLGFGIQPPTPSWGSMLSEGRVYMTTAWWLTVFPGLGIVTLTLFINLLGDKLRDILDPKLRIN
jgi:peptide/nickel transport system permease protein